MSQESLRQIQAEWHGSFSTYVTGFVSCLLLTGLAFFLVITRALSEPLLIGGVVGLALIQAIVQLLCFLHVGTEDKPRWETVVFYFMVMVLLIIAIGSLWIMYDLNTRLMPEMID